MNIELVDSMGSDLSVVNAARVSFAKESEWDYNTGFAAMKDADAKLISYLAKNGHWSPFAHTAVSFRWKAPIFVARQLVKHQVGLTWNEVSRRYVKDEPELWWPEKWRKSAENVKQGSSDEEYDEFDESLTSSIHFAHRLVDHYTDLTESGLCPEQARMFLPLNTYTEWIWTGSLYAWARVYKQRTDPHAQKETRDLVQKLDPILSDLFPHSWKALKE